MIIITRIAASVRVSMCVSEWLVFGRISRTVGGLYDSPFASVVTRDAEPEPEPEPEPPESTHFGRSRSRSRSRRNGLLGAGAGAGAVKKLSEWLRLRKWIQLWKNYGMLTAK